MRIFDVKHCCAHIPLGKQGENNAQLIRFPFVAEWKELYGDGYFVVTHQRAGDSSPYPVQLSGIDGNNVTWVITSADVADVGAGICELTYHVGEIVAKSASYITTTTKSETCSIPTPPDPYEAWFDAITEKIGNLDDLETTDKSNLVAAINEALNGSGVVDHRELTNRDAPNQHPISAITELQDELDSKVDVDQGVSHAGELLVVGDDGKVTTQAFDTLEGGSY